MTDTDLPLLDACQRGFPLSPRPYAELAARLGTTEAGLLALLEHARRVGVLGRVGAVFAPGAVGASTLAALAVPPARLDAVAARVGRHREVNHNYAREHHYSLWFVVAASTRGRVDQVLATIADDCRHPLLDLPLEREYHIDLGFALDGADAPRTPPPPVAPQALADDERALVAALGDGLALAPRPYARLANRCGRDEAWVLATLARWLEQGVIRRLGAVLRHRELGYTANAMCVWQVAPEQRDALGARLAQDPAVRLCYARPPRPLWPYNLFAMVHGKSRDATCATVAALAARHGLDALPQARLFSTRRYVQRGALYD